MKVLNKTFDERSIEMKLLNMEGDIQILGGPIAMPPQEPALTKFFVSVDKRSLTKMNTPVEIGIYSDGKEVQRIVSSFLGPVEKKQ